MKIKINGKIKEVDENITVLELLNSLNLKADRIVVEHNHKILNKEDFSKTIIKEGDHLEVVHFVGGG